MDYDQFLYDDFPVLLESIHTDHQPQWGSMNAQQMIEHLQTLFSISNGKNEAPAAADLEKMAYRKSRFFEKYMPMPKNFQSVAKPGERLTYADMETAKTHLMQDFERFHYYLIEHPDIHPLHPYFGPLNYDEWVQFHARHIRHHFTQFGLLEEPEIPA